MTHAVDQATSGEPLSSTSAATPDKAIARTGSHGVTKWLLAVGSE